MPEHRLRTEVVVLGSGPGGYSAAFRAADLGKKVVLVEQHARLGGVCLNVGCIPSKALLHIAKVIDEAQALSAYGVHFGTPKMDMKKILTWKDQVVGRLTNGLSTLAKQRGVTVVTGVGKFSGPHTLCVTSDSGEQTIQFDQAIIAAGSQPVRLPLVPEDPRIVDSTGALTLPNPQGKWLVIGGGIIGLEMATVYRALGAEVTIVEWKDQLMPGCDADVVAPFYQYVRTHYRAIRLETKVTHIKAQKKGLLVTFEGVHAPKKPECFDHILLSVGRHPNGGLIGADQAGVQVDDRGFITVDEQLRTNVPHIFAIGDIVGNPMLAHKAVAEGRVAAEVIAGKQHRFDPSGIPSVAYTDPEVAWVGLTENQAKAEGIAYKKSVFPWMASGRALSCGRSEGLTKLLFDPTSGRLLGGAIVGTNAGELIAEVTLALEMGCDGEDMALTIHPHPTLSESVMMAAEIFEGTITDLYLPRKKPSDS